jgi:hypothetical protein
LSTWRRIQSAEIRSYNVDLAPMTASHPRHVIAERFIGRTVRKEKRTNGQAAVSEIWRSGGVVR